MYCLRWLKSLWLSVVKIVAHGRQYITHQFFLFFLCLFWGAPSTVGGEGGLLLFFNINILLLLLFNKILLSECFLVFDRHELFLFERFLSFYYILPTLYIYFRITDFHLSSLFHYCWCIIFIIFIIVVAISMSWFLIDLTFYEWYHFVLYLSIHQIF